MTKSRRVNEEISELVRGFDIAYGRAVSEFLPWLIENLADRRGRTFKQIIDEGWSLFDVGSKIENAVTQKAIESAILKAKSLEPNVQIDEKALRSAVLYEAWASDGINLARRMKRADTASRRLLAKQVEADFKKASNVSKNLDKINNNVKRGVSEADLRKEVREITKSIRAQGFNKSYEKTLKQLERDIKKLSDRANTETGATRRAYNKFINAVRSESAEAFEEAVENAVKVKSRYISRRISRTENARSQIDSLLAIAEDDDDVVAFRWTLSTKHNVTDICDIHAKADFGLGQGVYPKNKIPPIPAHSHCLCYLTDIFRDEVDDLRKFNYSKGGDAWLKKQPVKEQNMILGSVKRGKQFRSGKSWDKSINAQGGEPKPESIKSRFSKAFDSKFIRE